MVVVHTALLWGWNDPALTVKERKRVAMAACNQVAFDQGYTRPLAASQLPRWYGLLNAAILSGEEQDPLAPCHSGKASYVDTVEKQHPGYLHSLYRYAVSVKGHLATFNDIAQTMNERSASPGETRSTLSLSRRQVANWFKAQGGKEYSAIEKPYLTDTHKKDRMQWAKDDFNLLTNPKEPVIFMDEK